MSSLTSNLISLNGIIPELKRRCKRELWQERKKEAYGKHFTGLYEVRYCPSSQHCFSRHPSYASLGPDPENPRPLTVGIARIYRGLGISALRSITTHGLLWTFFDLTAGYIDRLPSGNAGDDRLA